jgi:hypothetical protein
MNTAGERGAEKTYRGGAEDEGRKIRRAKAPRARSKLLTVHGCLLTVPSSRLTA